MVKIESSANRLRATGVEQTNRNIASEVEQQAAVDQLEEISTAISALN